MSEITISIATKGLTTAEQMRAALIAKRDDELEARRLLVEQQQRELAAIDGGLQLFNARIAELDEFIAFRRTRPRG